MENQLPRLPYIDIQPYEYMIGHQRYHLIKN